MKVLEELGGSPKLEVNGKNLLIRSSSCPLSVAVAEHPEVCQVAEALVSYITGRRVKEHCERGDTLKCRFELTAK